MPIINTMAALCFMLAVVLPRKCGQAVMSIITSSDKQKIKIRALLKGAGDFSVEEL